MNKCNKLSAEDSYLDDIHDKLIADDEGAKDEWMYNNEIADIAKEQDVIDEQVRLYDLYLKSPVRGFDDLLRQWKHETVIYDFVRKYFHAYQNSWRRHAKHPINYHSCATYSESIGVDLVSLNEWGRIGKQCQLLTKTEGGKKCISTAMSFVACELQSKTFITDLLYEGKDHFTRPMDLFNNYEVVKGLRWFTAGPLSQFFQYIQDNNTSITALHIVGDSTDHLWTLKEDANILLVSSLEQLERIHFGDCYIENGAITKLMNSISSNLIEVELKNVRMKRTAMIRFVRCLNERGLFSADWELEHTSFDEVVVNSMILSC